jgi:predicted homoserine dehydrogenase-like protein
MVTSFADGSKISFEQAIAANATGFVVKSRGMSRGMEYKGDVMKIGELYDIERSADWAALSTIGRHAAYEGHVLAEHPIPAKSIISQSL